jgi:hypothetical protein
LLLQLIQVVAVNTAATTANNALFFNKLCVIRASIENLSSRDCLTDNRCYLP